MPEKFSSDDRAYLRLVARCLWQPGLQRHLDLSDVVQDALGEAHACQAQFRGTTPEEWRGWLRTILKRKLLRAIDNQPGEASVNESSRRLEDALAAEQTSPSQGAVRNEQLERLALALDQLPEAERVAVELKYVHDCSVEFISGTMGRTPDAVGGLLKRGKERLKRLLEERP